MRKIEVSEIRWEFHCVESFPCCICYERESKLFAVFEDNGARLKIPVCFECNKISDEELTKFFANRGLVFEYLKNSDDPKRLISTFKKAIGRNK